MKKRTKIILAVTGVILVLLLGGLGYAGNYFYTLAIDTTSDKSIVFGNMTANPEQIQAEDKAYAKFMKAGSDVYLQDVDGYRLHAYQKTKKSHIWVIAVHGYMGEGKNMSAVGNIFSDKNYNVLIPDLRSHGKSEGSAIGMGTWDSDDILEWISYITKQDNQAEIALYGVSMGASTVLMTTGKAVPTQVKVAIEDCGYTSAWEEFSYQLDELFQLPSFPALDAANLVTKLRAGYNLKDADALSAVKKSKTPTLFIHGDADDFVPYSMGTTLYEAASCEKELLTIKGAGHGQSKNIDPKRYWATVNRFLEHYL